MPTVGWIAEDATERFAEARHKPLPPTPLPSRIHCQLCGGAFRTSAAFAEHVSRAHPLELPALYVHGRPLLRDSVLRSPLMDSEVSVAPCTYCEISVDGGSWRRLSPAEFCDRFVQATDATWNVHMVHERPIDGSRAEEYYHLRFRIPDAAHLESVDQLFLETLVREELGQSDLDRFCRGLPDMAAAREYGAALGDYALGVILKEQRAPIRSHVGLDEFASKMRSALDILCHFQRPVALAVCGSIGFNLNAFLRDAPAGANVVELGAGFRFFRGITTEAAADETSGSAAPVAMSANPHPICPVDAVSHRLLTACDQMARRGLTPEEIEALWPLTADYPVTEQDLVKARVICAEGFLRLGRPDDATPHLRALQHTPMFKEWARSHLAALLTP
jgi:hypothetical protein